MFGGELGNRRAPERREEPVRRFAVLAAILAALPVIPSSALAEQERVVGGRDATRPYPWMASLQSSSGSHFCGGSLVRADWILTAKHCVRNRNPASFQVMLGSQKLSQPGQIHKIAEVVVDPNQNSDSAVLRLATPSALEPIRIAGLDERATWAPGELATAIGWGQTFFIVGPSPDHLQEVEVHVVSDADCARSYSNFDPETEVCAGETTGGKDTCQGDSGGPIMVPDATGKFIVFGTTFRGLGCALPLFYGIYARVGDDPIRSWLDTVLPPEPAPA